MKMFTQIVGPIAMFLHVRQLAQALRGACLRELRSTTITNQIYELPRFYASKKQIRLITDLWLKRVMLLVTGIDDVLAVLRRVNQEELYYLLIEKYGEQAKSVDNIILLLNKLWEFTAKNKETDSRVLQVELVLVERAKVLAATSPANRCSLGHLEALAEKIQDAVRDGRGSRASEDIIIALALPKIKGDLLGALKFVDSIVLIQAHHRFLTAFVKDNGVANSYQVNKLTEQVLASKLGGQELATTILQAVNTAGIEISGRTRGKLKHFSSNDGKVDSGFANFLEGLLSDDDSDDEDLSSMPDMFAMMAKLEALSNEFLMGKVHSQAGHGHSPWEDLGGLLGGSFGGSFSFTPRSLDKCFACEKLDDCPLPNADLARLIKTEGNVVNMHRQSFASEEETLMQLEKNILKIAEDGNIHRLKVNNMPIIVFLATHPEIISQEARATIQAALAK